jgi:hypothetical protein
VEKYPKYREELIIGGTALVTTALTLAAIIVVVYAWVSGSKGAFLLCELFYRLEKELLDVDRGNARDDTRRKCIATLKDSLGSIRAILQKRDLY